MAGELQLPRFNGDPRQRGEHRTMTNLEVTDGPKMILETLCVAQSAIEYSGIDGSRTQEHVERLGRLIDACGVHWPLGQDGKHGELHTPTCGCDG